MELFERHQGGERAILVHVKIRQLEDIDAQEFVLLAQSAGAQILQQMTAQRDTPDPKLFVGSGKAVEIALLVEELEADLVIFDHRLTPAQERNLERIVKCRVLDRTGLILDIFAQRARTFEGKLQVELAQLEHLSSRLVRGWTHLERQKGGIGLRGPGETQLETDRRLLGHRVAQLKQRLEKVKQTRQQGRAARKKANIPTISLVGYTNAGKSSLFNLLTNDAVYAADQLFATLDPTLRKSSWAGLGTVVLADTVGFVKHLPHSLVDAFKATLEETLEADLLLHVIDGSNPDHFEQIKAVDAVLNDIGCDVPMLKVYNKIDLSGEPAGMILAQANEPDRVYLSVHQNLGIDFLQEAVRLRLSNSIIHFNLKLQPQHGKLRHVLFYKQLVEQEICDDSGLQLLQVRMPQSELKMLLEQLHINAYDILPAAQAQIISPARNEIDQLIFEKRRHTKI